MVNGLRNESRTALPERTRRRETAAAAPTWSVHERYVARSPYRAENR